MIARISLDAMGGDHGPKIVVNAGLRALRRHPDLHIIFVGEQRAIEKIVRSRGHDIESRWQIYHADQVVQMDESPLNAVRQKKNSSMRKAIDLVKEGLADACVSAGNTGALVATARFVLKTLPGIDRPALVTHVPTLKAEKEVTMLDVGANSETVARHLVQFALMGSILHQLCYNVAQPKVALINMGVEDIKGNTLVKHADKLLSHCDAVNYVGYVEGDDIFSSQIDVAVCDGFVGNVSLKVAEGISRLSSFYISRFFSANLWNKLIGSLAKPIISPLKNFLDPQQRNGATIIGLNGVIVKSHGSAGVVGVAKAIDRALDQVKQNMIELLKSKSALLLPFGDSDGL